MRRRNRYETDRTKIWAILRFIVFTYSMSNSQVVMSITMDDWEDLKRALGDPEPLIDHAGIVVDDAEHREQPGRKRRKE